MSAPWYCQVLKFALFPVPGHMFFTDAPVLADEPRGGGRRVREERLPLMRREPFAFSDADQSAQLPVLTVGHGWPLGWLPAYFA